MEKRYYIDGKCVLSYDDDVFSTDDDYTNIKELFIYPAVDKVNVKYYEKEHESEACKIRYQNHR